MRSGLINKALAAIRSQKRWGRVPCNALVFTHYGSTFRNTPHRLHIDA
jgi:hypothetical protein